MKFRRLATGVIAAGCAISAVIAPVAEAQASTTALSGDANGYTWYTDPASGSLGSIVNTLVSVLVTPVMLSTIFLPGCHMMNTTACVAPTE